MPRIRLPALPAARLWARAGLRRPGRGLLVVTGLLAMTVATVAAMVAGDSLETLFIEDVRAQWGHVDVVTVRPGDAFIEESTARTAGIQGPGPDAAWAGRLILDAVVWTDSTRFREPDARILGLSADERSFGYTAQGHGVVDVEQLAPEQVILNERLAARIDAGIGDVVELVIAIPEVVERQPNGVKKVSDPRTARWSPTVAGIALDEGVADFGRTPNLLTRLDTLQRVAELEGKVSALHVAAPAPGRDAAEDVTASLETINRQIGLVALEAKEDALDIAREEGGIFRGILLTLALLVVAAAAVVTANLVFLLGQERAREVALLRALGATRREVARLFVVEAGAYALAAVALGTVLALPLADLLAGGIAEHFAGINAGRGREQLMLALEARPGTVVSAVLIVLAVALGTIWVAARRVAQVATAEVLRGAPPLLPPDERRSLRRVRVVRGAGLLSGGMGLTADGGGDLLRFLGLSLLLVAWWLQVRARRPAGPRRRRLDDRAALAGLLWSIAAPAALGDFAAGVQSSFGLLTFAGVGAVACATVLAAGRMPSLMRLVRVNLPLSVQAPLRTAGAYAGHQPSRAATVVATVAIVVFMVAALNVLGSATDIGAARQAGGYSVIGTAPVAVDPAGLQAVPGVLRVDAMTHIDMGEAWFSTRDADDETAAVPYPLRAVELDAGFIGAQRFDLAAGLPRFADAEQALEAAMAGEGVVIDRYARPEGAQPGHDVVLDDGRGEVTFELLAVLDTYVLQGVLIGSEQYSELFPARGPTLVLAAGGPGADPDELAGDLSLVGATSGLRVDPIARAADEVVRVNRTFTDIFALMLLLGLAVALVAVGVLVARSARERRAHLALLGATGMGRGGVRLLLLAEPALQAVTGLVIGLGVGLGTLWLLFRRGFADLAFIADWPRLAALSGSVVGLVLVVSLLPATRAARRPVDEGLRDLG